MMFMVYGFSRFDLGWARHYWAKLLLKWCIRAGWPVLAVLSAYGATAVSSRPTVTFNRDIAPIVYGNCSVCHRPGESAPFSLLTYEDVKRHAAQIAAVTKRRYMPPFLPEAGYGDFKEERRLTDKQIELIQDWVKQGAPAGSAAHAPVPPKFTSEWQLGPPDLILHVNKPYTLIRLGAGGVLEFRYSRCRSPQSGG